MDEREIQKIREAITREFAGHTITLTEDLRFEVTGPEFVSVRQPRDRVFDALTDAKANIMERIKESEKVAALKINFRFDLVDANGKTYEVTRINRTTGLLVESQSRELYPNTKWVRDMIARRRAARLELDEIDNKLRSLQISNQRGYGRITADELPSTIKVLQEHYNAAVKAEREFTAPVVIHKEDADVA